MTPLLRIGCFFLGLVTPLAAQSSTPQDVELGKRLFQTHCSYCHGTAGRGGRGADLTLGRYRHGGSDRELFETIRNGIKGTEMGAVRATDEEVWRMVAFVKHLGKAGGSDIVSGDPATGKLVYESKGGCAACHVINNRGGNLGPELTEIGRFRGAESLEESLLNPAADLPVDYRGVRVLTKSGAMVAGVRLNEDDFSIQLRDTQDNLRSFLKDNLKEIQRDRPSLMPAYGSILTKKELTDLVAYLSSLRGTP